MYAATPMIRIVVDTDPGVDDALALILALRSPRAQVMGIGTVAGNVEVESATENALKVLRLLGRAEVPVAQGCAAPLVEPFHGAHGVHGRDGLGDCGLPPSGLRPSAEHAADQLVRLAREWEGALVVVALGPLTNLATALLKDPRLPGRVRRVVAMAGAFGVSGNVTPAAEFNVWADPEAAERVFSAGWPLTLVGLDVTRQALLADEHLERLAGAPGPVPPFVQAIVQAPMAFAAARSGLRALALHDPLAMAIALDPTLASDAPELPVAVELRGAWTRGATLADRRSQPAERGLGPARAQVCLRADVPRFLAAFLETLAG
ncbi:MAG: nucleoside hydrolase [Chloroflexi bacterium]|nr:nucleoside hydrolase [Chloroflexota bacterium]